MASYLKMIGGVGLRSLSFLAWLLFTLVVVASVGDTIHVLIDDTGYPWGRHGALLGWTYESREIFLVGHVVSLPIPIVMAVLFYRASVNERLKLHALAWGALAVLHVLGPSDWLRQITHAIVR